MLCSEGIEGNLGVVALAATHCRSTDGKELPISAMLAKLPTLDTRHTRHVLERETNGRRICLSAGLSQEVPFLSAVSLLPSTDKS